MGREVSQAGNGSPVQGTKVGHIAFIERQRVLVQDDIAILRGNGRSHPRAVAPEILFALFFSTRQAALDWYSF